jgi:hypothetical protein
MACLGSEVLITAVSDAVEAAGAFEFSTFTGNVTTRPIASLTIGSAPEFDATPPLLASITFPNPLAGDVPQAPDLSLVEHPVAPTLTLPEVPTLLSLDIPDEPVVNLPVFDEVFRTAPIIPNSETFTWSDQAYASQLLTNLALKQSQFILGMATALPEDVEALISDRVRDTPARQDQDAVTAAFEVSGSRGHMLPNGAQLRQLADEFEAGLDTVSEKSRELMLEQVRLEQQNMLLGMVSGIQQQVMVFDDHNKMQQRILDAAKIAVDSKVALFNAQLGLARVDVQVFSTLADIFRDKLKAQLAKLEVFKAQLEARKLVAELDESAVNLYVAQIEGVKAKVDIYKSTVEAARTKVLTDLNNVEKFKSQVDGAKYALLGEKSKVDGFVEQIKAETQAFTVFAAKADAHKNKAQVYKKLVDAQVATQLAEFNANQKAPLEVYKQQNNAFKAQVDAERSRIEAVSGIQGELANLYKANVSSVLKTEAARMDSEGANLKSQWANRRVGEAHADAADRIAIAAAALNATRQRASLQATAMREAAEISVETFNQSYNDSTSTSTSTSESHNESDTESCTHINSSVGSTSYNTTNSQSVEGIAIDTSGRGPHLGRCRTTTGIQGT